MILDPVRMLTELIWAAVANKANTWRASDSHRVIPVVEDARRPCRRCTSACMEVVRQIPLRPGGNLRADRPDRRRTAPRAWSVSAWRRLGRYPDEQRPDVPWQRVINAQGKISPRGVGLGALLQRELLEEEGVEFTDAGRVSFRRFGWLDPYQGEDGKVDAVHPPGLIEPDMGLGSAAIAHRHRVGAASSAIVRGMQGRGRKWWGRRDSNPHAQGHMILSHARLPIPTLPRGRRRGPDQYNREAGSPCR